MLAARDGRKEIAPLPLTCLTKRKLKDDRKRPPLYLEITDLPLFPIKTSARNKNDVTRKASNRSLACGVTLVWGRSGRRIRKV